MSGHSKWATTKHKKAVIDARRHLDRQSLGSLHAAAALTG